MQGAREFLSKVLPWEQNGDQIYFNIHWRAPWSNQPPGQKNHFWDGRACSSLTEMVKQLTYLNKSPERDFYICMSSQSRCEEKVSRKGSAYKRAVRFRDNVVALKSFYIDVDVKPESYKTQQEALDAFELFIASVDLPMPSVVVGSGSGGFHAHWVVDRVLDLATWQPVANALANACQSVGLICDTQCTIDSARILRIPGSLNHKHSPPKDVTLISNGEIVSFDDFKETLEPYNVFTPVATNDLIQFPFPRRQPTIEGSELGAGIVIYEAPKPSLGDVAEACPFIEDAWVDGGEKYNNPQWFMTLQVAAHLEGGRAAAHKMSCGHKGYTPEDTDEQFDRIVREHQARDIGWPQCQKIKSSGAEQCATCPHLSQNKSPFNFTNLPAPTLAPIPTAIGSSAPPDIWPDKFSRGADGLIYLQEILDSGAVNQRKVCPYQISTGWLQDKPWKLHFTAIVALSKVAKVEVPLVEFGAMGGTRKTLSEHGLVLSDRDFKATQEFLLAWTQKLQGQKNAVVSSTPYGWSLKDDGSIEGFTYAGRVWCDGYDRPAALDDLELFDTYSPHGNIDPWLEASKVVTDQKRPCLNVVLASSFGAPLMRFVGHKGLLIAGYSGDSGTGKTSAMETGLSVWGSASRGKQGLDDTGNSLFGKMGKLKSLPIYWDEIQDPKQMEQAVKTLFKLTEGVEKSRMNQDRTLSKRGTWQTLMVSTANQSMIEPILFANKSHNAGLMRVFQFHVNTPKSTDLGQIEIAKATRIFSKLADHYGHAGLIYAQFLGANHARISKEISEINDKLNKRLEAKNEERFWTSAMALILAGAHFGNELNLTRIEIPPLEKFLDRTFQEMRDTVKESPVDMKNRSSVVNILAQYLTTNRANNTLITNRMTAGAGKPMKGSITILNDTSRLGAIYIQLGRDDGLIRFSVSNISRWLGDHGFPKGPFLDALQAELGFKRTNGVIGAGTALSTGFKEHLFEVSIVGNAKLKEFIELP